MPRTLRSLPPLFAIAAALLLPHAAEAQLNVEGAWTVTEWEVGGETTSTPQPGIFIFTSTHYSIFFVNQDEPRAVGIASGQNGTEAQRAGAYDEFTANAGRYSIEGNTVTTRAYLAKNPGYMAAWPDNVQTYTGSRDGDALTLTFGNGAVATLVRREGQTPPG